MTGEHLQVVHGDITRMEVDAIVNAANSGLLGGGGVDGAIHGAGGPAIGNACRAIRDTQGGCKTGEAVITTGGLLPAPYVIHAVGPVWKGGGQDEDALLANAYRNSIRLAAEHDLRTVAFPNISTGIYGFPRERAADIAIAAVREALKRAPTIEQVTFVCFDDENYRLYRDRLA
ncbi:O-acetyl-ADP-ribose deacetylase [Cupriavidus plantarum]|uniref:O-acetyl-ADP-ribose deacetylase (Regulator of RNase III) n=1 Tax=Cupriavidus plantarum TaxID=942865 RepID=A0A316F0F4_9BURK|nr:O-acetyl-ADP-ribose deacetylase [Cupriavidus plantarum]NYH99993.1 O-acetyl-ADP-ribose deacetylase (regulator of RNase III) [Cupriavidus plantarum]PWK37188.1 O-acetyl-ADP-ribose deacetylase (regulator of RNase III) [Cupriavidus plantarum]REF02075.1 O-acetyl-ADP-ribose deacetylase (regulator of RNase III) [Cupriavidus plantarum]RLK45078.1 O-acetyl-ADP-ribose deacetylase (regulator of RNase III) [Cupriavidus plantarum]CAG2129659.1 O-acetyl-ADP-ribose deacetylase [Cupriavidus plantarum]